MFAGGALFVKYKLDTVRAAVLQAAESRTGLRLELGAVTVTGLRGIRIDDLRLAVEPAAGLHAELHVPNAYVYIDLVDLLYGEIVVERVQIDGSTLHVSRTTETGDAGTWRPLETLGLPTASEGKQRGAFRVLGKDCALVVSNALKDKDLRMDSLDFDVYRLADSRDILAKAAGAFDGDPSKALSATLFFTALDEFELKAECAEITAEDVAGFLPASERFLESGAVHPKIRLVAYPNQTLMVWAESDFEDLYLRNQPPFLRPATGRATFLADYDLTNRVLSFDTSRVESDQIGGGKLEGQIDFSAERPVFDLRMQVTRLPAQELLDFVVRGRAEAYGELDISLGEPFEVTLALAGDTENPQFATRISAAGGALSMNSKDPNHPSGQLHFSMVQGTWDSTSGDGAVSFNVVGGEMRHPRSGLQARNVTGAMVLRDKTLQIEPLNAEISGHPVIGTLRYDLETSKGQATLSGTLDRIEDTILGTVIEDVSISGLAGVKAEVAFERDRIIVTADVEATQTQVDYRWYFRKPVGLGARAQGRIEIRPRASVDITADASALGTLLSARFHMAHTGKRWSLQTFDATGDQADIGMVAGCLLLPYQVSGGKVTDVRYSWVRDDNEKRTWHASLRCGFDELHLKPADSEHTHHLHGGEVEIALNKGEPSKGHLALNVKQATMAPIGAGWFAPMTCPPELQDRFPPTPRDWTYDLAGEEVETAPWKGRRFAGKGYFAEGEAGLRAFSAEIDEKGRIEGMYRHDRRDNAYEASFRWESVPAHYLLSHLKWPDILSGVTDGSVAYSVDRDDPGTLAGAGRFAVNDGQFSADFIFSQLASRMEDDVGMLPPSLRFSELRADIEFHKDIVQTRNLAIVAPGLTLTGNGQHVTEGDMDYEISLAVSPDMADRIPVLRDNFSVQGHRIAGRDIELKFRIAGPTLKPRGELAEIPSPSIMLVSGALQATSDAMKVIDIPRKIFVDVLKIGAGIVGARVPASEGSRP